VDDNAFDRWTRLFSSLASRRGTLRALLRTVLGGTLVEQFPGGLAAAGNQSDQSTGPCGTAGACPSDRPTCCDNSCVNTGSNPEHCSRCGNRCAPDEACEEVSVSSGSVCPGPEVQYQCVTCSDESRCGDFCQPCPAPPGPGTGNNDRGGCCPDKTCKCNGECCKTGDACFYEVQLPVGAATPVGQQTSEGASCREFCCLGSGGKICNNGNLVFCCLYDVPCEVCEGPDDRHFNYHRAPR